MVESTARERLMEARRLIESVMAELDLELIDCPCPDHTRHYRNWSDAQTYQRLEGYAHQLGRVAGGESIQMLSQEGQHGQESTVHDPEGSERPVPDGAGARGRAGRPQGTGRAARA